MDKPLSSLLGQIRASPTTTATASQLARSTATILTLLISTLLIIIIGEPLIISSPAQSSSLSPPNTINYYYEQQQQPNQQQPYYSYNHQRQQQPTTTTITNTNQLGNGGLNGRLFPSTAAPLEPSIVPTTTNSLSFELHKHNLNRHSQIVNQQRSLLAGSTAPQSPPSTLTHMIITNQTPNGPQEVRDMNSGDNKQISNQMINNDNLPPRSAAITAINFNNNNNQMGDSSPLAGSVTSTSYQPQPSSINLECSDKLCYGLPMNCKPPQLNGSGVGGGTLHSSTSLKAETSEPCTMWITARHVVDSNRPVARDILFELNSKVNPKSSSYAAVGFSPTGRMQGFVFECLHNKDSENPSESVAMQFSFNQAGLYTNIPATVSSGYKPIRNLQEDGYYSCRWMVESAVEFAYTLDNGTTNVKREDLGYKNYHILLAVGDYDTNTYLKSQHTDRVSSMVPVNLAQSGQLKSTASHILIRIHGSMMVVIWAGLVTSSIIIARYYKNEWADSKLNGVALWFIIHRALMLTAWFGSIIAAIFAYMYTGVYHPGVHQLCGSACLALSTLQVIGGVVRPSLESSRRVFFNWAHFISGNLAHTFAMICLISASFLAPAHLPPAYLWVVVAFTATYATVHIIMTIHQYIMHKSSKISITPMNNLNSSPSGTYNSGAVADSYSKSSSSPFRQFMLGIFVTLAIIFVSLLVILISNKLN